MRELPATRPSPADADAQPYLMIRVGDELYALPGPSVGEVMRWRAYVPVPGAPPVIPGIISQRGTIMTVVDLRLLLGLTAGPPDRATRLVVVQREPHDLALLVDAVLDLFALPAAALSHPPAALDPGRARLLSAAARYDDRPIGILDLAALAATVAEA